MAHPPPPPYSIALRELPATRRFEVPAAFVEEALRGLPLREALGAPSPDPDAGGGVAEVELYADGETVFLTGRFRGHLHVACSRCVEAARLEIDEALRVTFLPGAQVPEADRPGPPGDPAPARRGGGRPEPASADDEDEGVEGTVDDVDVFPHDGERVDLEPMLREQFVLAVPFAPLCREDCRGLCPQCGINRNAASCSCEKPIDPRLAALKGLKLPS